MVINMKKITAILTVSGILLSMVQLAMAENGAIELKEIAKEDFADYGVSKNTNFRDYPASKESNVSLGTGFSGKWSATYSEISDFTGVWPKLSNINDGCAYGSATTGSIYRNLQSYIPTDVDGSYYITFEMGVGGDAQAITGFSLMNDDLVIGNAVNSDETVASIAYKNDVTYSEKKIATDKTTYYYSVQLDIFAEKEDLISLKVTDTFSEKIPESYDVTKTVELGTDGISNVGIKFATTPTYLNRFTISKMEAVSAEVLIETINALMSEWKNSVENTDLEKYREITEEIHSMVKNLEKYDIAPEEIEGMNEFLTLTDVEAGADYGSMPIDISANFNSGIYGNKNSTTPNNPNVITGPNVGFEINDFKALDGWKKNWIDVENHFNIFNLGGINYNLKVQENDSRTTSTNCAWRTHDEKIASKEIDIEDGSYEKISILANTDTLWYGPGHDKGWLGVILKYKDGTQEFSENPLSNGNVSRKAYGNEIESTGIDGKKVMYDKSLYIHAYNIDANPEKVLDKIEVLNSYALIDSEGVVYFDTAKTAHTYRATLYAVTALKNKNLRIMECYNELNDLLDVLPETITSKDYEIAGEISEILDELEELGVDTYELSGVNSFRENTKYIPKLRKTDVEANLDKVVINAEFSTDITNVNLNLTKDGVVVKNYVCKVNGKKITLTMENDYDYKAKYILTFNEDIKASEMQNLTLGETKKLEFTVPIAFDVAKFEVRDKNGGTLSSSDDLQGAVSNETIYGDFEIKNYTLEETVKTAVTIAVYSADGEMVASLSKAADLAKGDSILWENVEIYTGLKSLKGGKIKMYIWDTFSDMNDFYKDYEINF